MRRTKKSTGRKPKDSAEPIWQTEISCLLGEIDLPWKEADGSWRALVQSGDTGCDVVATPIGTTVQIRSTLATWDDPLSPVCRKALTRFIQIVNDRLRFARLILDDHHVLAESIVRQDKIDNEFTDCVHAVIAAGHLVSHETRALLSPDVAQAYMAVAVEVARTNKKRASKSSTQRRRGKS